MAIKMKLICRGCQSEIIEKKEKYVHIEDWECNKLKIDSWWHLKCFNKAMNRELTALEKKAGFMLDMAGRIFNKLPEELKPEVEYEIK